LGAAVLVGAPWALVLAWWLCFCCNSPQGACSSSVLLLLAARPVGVPPRHSGLRLDGQRRRDFEIAHAPFKNGEVALQTSL